MTDRPILFSDPMVRALLTGTKTQTRRVISAEQRRTKVNLFDGTWSDSYVLDPGNQSWREDGYPWRVGDRLYVREAWRCNGWASDVATIMYRASEGDGYTAMTGQYPVDEGKKALRVTGTWHPGIHMPRWASRLTLLVTEVRVQRLQDIGHVDAAAEGCLGIGSYPDAYEVAPRDQYRNLWNKLNADRGFGWETNPWCVAVSFSVERRNIDEVAK